jgi:hypothetical protein
MVAQEAATANLRMQTFDVEPRTAANYITPQPNYSIHGFFRVASSTNMAGRTKRTAATRLGLFAQRASASHPPRLYL